MDWVMIMCRLLLLLNKVKDPAVGFAIQSHMRDLQIALGGHGNGVFIPSEEPNFQMKKSYFLDEIWDHVAFNRGAPFMFHTRLANSGSISIPNMHPYEIDNTVLMQNGSAPTYGNKNKSDTLDLFETWKKKGGSLLDQDYEWSGNIVTYDKDTQDLDLYIRRGMEYVTLTDGTVLLTSQITKSLKPFIKKDVYFDGWWKGQFNSTKIDQKAVFFQMPTTLDLKDS